MAIELMPLGKSQPIRKLSLIDSPKVILSKFLSYLTLHDVCVVATICHSFKQLGNETELWKSTFPKYVHDLVKDSKRTLHPNFFKDLYTGNIFSNSPYVTSIPAPCAVKNLCVVATYAFCISDQRVCSLDLITKRWSEQSFPEPIYKIITNQENLLAEGYSKKTYTHALDVMKPSSSSFMSNRAHKIHILSDFMTFTISTAISTFTIKHNNAEESILEATVQANKIITLVTQKNGSFHIVIYDFFAKK